jgi:ribA/ribD-fused uncharacterized protein
LGKRLKEENMAITSFKESYSWLSNFSKHPVVFEGMTYCSVEHAFQAAKTLDIQRPTGTTRDVKKAGHGIVYEPTIYRSDFQDNANPVIAKRMGKSRKDLNFRNDWEAVKDEVMYSCLWDKFTKNDDLQQKLVNTGTEELIEGNTWGDRIWGCTWDGSQWIGQNRLGKALMKIRKELQVMVTAT